MGTDSRGLASAYHMYRQYKYHAKRRGLIFELTKEKFLELVVQKCVFCGRAPTQKSVFINAGKRHEPFYYNGIDRLDNTKGYVEGNMVTCCVVCNRIKSYYSLKFLSSHLVKMAHSIKRMVR